jgi:signal transduction histidine kinase
MVTLDSVIGAGFLVNASYRVTEGNDRGQAVFRTDLARIRGESLDELCGAGMLDSQSLARWKQAVDTAFSEQGETNARIEISPSGTEDSYTYTLRARRQGPNAETVCCSLRSVGSTRQYEQTITALHEATRDLMTAPGTRVVLERTAVAANEVLGFPGTGVRRYDPEAELLRHVSLGARVENIDSRPPYSVDSSPHGRALKRGETVIDDIGEDDPYDRDVFTQTMYIPIGKKGLLSVGTVGSTFNETDVQFAEILAENAAAAIRMTETTQSLRKERERLDLLRQVLTRALRHNIRNDMNVIGTNAELLAPHVPADKQSHLDTIRAKVEEMATLSEKASTLEQITDDSYGCRAFEITRTVAAAVEQIRREFPQRQIDCEFDDPCTVRAHDGFDIAVENLLENACKHSTPGNPIRVGTDNGPDEVTTTVRDNGSGIPENEIDVLDVGTETSLQHSSGLGLWIVRWVLQQSDGELCFENEDGTNVELTVPRAE